MTFILNLSLTLVGPVMTTGFEAARFGRDDAFLRDAEGAIIIPGTQVRGIVRHVLRSMAAAMAPGKLVQADIDRWFGNASANRDQTAPNTGFYGPARGWEPARGILRFSDLRSGANPDTGSITRIAVDEATGSVQEGSLQVLECPIGIGECAIFSGTMTVTTSEDEAKVIRGWIEKALKLVPALGAHKSVGFGRVEAVTVSEPTPSQAAAAAIDAATAQKLAKAGAVEIALQFDGPFLVSTRRWLGNSFLGSSSVPGSVIKAVAACAIGADDPAHPQHVVVSKAVFCEARPTKNQRPQTPPLSRYVVTDESGQTVFDAFDDAPEYYASFGEIAFKPDWKVTPDQVKTEYGKEFDPELEVRTRTAIDPTGMADEGKLFSRAAIKPGGRTWKGLIARGELSEAEFASLLAALPGKLEGIGKTRTGATMTIQAPAPDTTSAVAAGRVRFVLETDAALHTPDDVFSHQKIVDPGERLRHQYQDYFAAALKERAPRLAVDADALKLRFFARQKRVGGYLAARYPPSDVGYSPWFVTCVGSAFELELPATHVEAFRSFVVRGLPVPAGFDARRRSWQGNPFVPENGFGEIRILPVQPRPEEQP